MVERANEGDLVTIDYTGWIKGNDEHFDTTEDKKPLQFKLGNNHTIQGFEDAIKGMIVSEVKKVEIPMELGYGPRLNELVIKMPETTLSGQIIPEVGKILAIKSPHGNIMPGKIVKMENKELTIDMNKPLAGHDLIFKIKLLELEKK